MAVGREQLLRLTLGVDEGRDGSAHDLRTEPFDRSLHPLDERRVRRVPRPYRRRADDEELGVLRHAGRELRVDHVLRTDGFGIVRERDVVGQDPAEQRGADERHRDEEHDPRRERAPRVAAAHAGQRFGIDPHGFLPGVRAAAHRRGAARSRSNLTDDRRRR